LAGVFAERGRVLLVGAILAIVIAALVGLALGGPSRKGTSAPQVAETASVAPSVSFGMVAPAVSSGAAVTEPTPTGAPAQPPVAGSEPIASVSAGGSAMSSSPSAGSSTSPSPSTNGSAGPDGKRLDSPGGFAYASCGGGKATLSYWEAKPGFTVDKVEPGPALTTSVAFAGTPTRYRMTVTCVAGTPTPVVLPL
jgi:hypothetical protein